MTEWKEYRLKDVCIFETKKISVKDISITNYISTENMISDKGGISQATNIPDNGTITKYSENDILVSNIRPYFKKIWYASKDGGCSNDVLCFSGNANLIFSRYLYYLLSQDDFFDYVMFGSKGCKMPRGDKAHIMDFVFSLPPLSEQQAIASILSSFDDKIDLLNRQNDTLEKMAETLFRKWFVVEAKEEWKEKPLSQIANFLNGLACQKFLPKDDIHKLPVLKIKELNNGITDDSDWATTDIDKDYIVENGDVIFAWSASLMVKIWNGEKCILNQHLFKVTSKDYPKWFYLMWCKRYLEEFKAIAITHATTMGHIKRGDLDRAFVAIPTQSELKNMTHKMQPIIDKFISNNKQICTLTALRDTLLPKLMSGDVKVNVSFN